MEPRRRADLVTAFAAPLPATVISELLAVHQPDRENLRQWSSASFNEHDGTARRHATGNLTQYITGLIAAETAIPAIPARFPGLSLDTSPENLRWRHTRLIRGLESLPVRW